MEQHCPIYIQFSQILIYQRPLLVHADLSEPFVIEINASNYALGAILSQPGSDQNLWPIAFHSQKFTRTKINYEIYDKELLAIITAFDEWWHYLVDAQHTTKYFVTIKIFTISWQSKPWIVVMPVGPFFLPISTSRLLSKEKQITFPDK